MRAIILGNQSPAAVLTRIVHACGPGTPGTSGPAKKFRGSKTAFSASSKIPDPSLHLSAFLQTEETMAPVNTRAKKIASLDEKSIKGMRPDPVFDISSPRDQHVADHHFPDHDPEAEGDASTEDGSDSEQEQADAAATEHYVSVGYVLLLTLSLSPACIHYTK